MPEPAPTRPYRLAVLASHVVQYQAPLYRMLAATPEVTPHVMFCSSHGAQAYWDGGFGRRVQWDVPLLDGYSHEMLPNVSPSPHQSRLGGMINPSVVSRLRAGRFDALLIHGWARATYWLGMLTAFAIGLPVLMRGESNLLTPGKPGRAALKRLALPAVFRRVTGFLAIGRYNCEFYRAHGVPDARIFLAPYAVDNAFFMRQAAGLPDRTALKRALGLPDVPLVLFSGKLIDVKRPLDLLHAFQRASRRHPAALAFVGDGPLAAAVQAAGVRDVHLFGFRNQTELSRFYGAADVFVLPSAFEPWGLVVNEAMCFGLPVVVSNCVGAGGDLVRPGVNGFVFPARDVEALAAALETLIADGATRTRMGHASRALIQEWGYHQTIAGIVRALDAVAGRRDAPGAGAVVAGSFG
jgi:glycosyltransferase involved in cell wall biosynthesis